MSKQLASGHGVRMRRARVALEGLSLGDAFGECFFSSAMQQRLAYRVLPDAPWFYTDDTMMAWSIVDVLEAHGAIEQDRLAQLFAERFRQQPHRSYGAGAIRLLTLIGDGHDWREASRDSRTDDVVFDKADAAESLEKMRESLEKIDEEIDALKKKLKSAEGDPERTALESALAKLESRKQALSVTIAEREEKGDEDE